MPRLARRKRLLWLTVGGGVLFAAAAGVTSWIVLRPGPTYRPGEKVEGLTADLARSLPPDYPRVTFTDVTDAAGIGFRHFGGARSSQLPEDMGSGAAWGDYDGDGWEDLVVVNEVGPVGLSEEEQRRSAARTVLYRNHGDGTFRDVTDQAGLAHRTWGMAAAWGDYDRDGRLDLVLTAYGRNVLYRNDGDGTFTDRSVASGLAGPPGFWTGASWADYDRDGFLDLYITGYVRFVHRDPTVITRHDGVEEPASLNPSSFRPERNLLYRNNGNGTFTEVAERAGVTDSAGRGLAAAWADFDEDGWPDLYVANDVSDNVLFRNLGNGRFEDVSHAARVADYRGAMGLAVGDWDGDGDQDLFITHWIAQENALYNNLRSQLTLGAGRAAPVALQFTDQADRYGLGQIALDFIGWGTSFLDYDNDGRLDLFVVNGSTFQERADPSRLVPMLSQLFWNRGPREGFFDVSPVGGPYFRTAYVGRGAAFADYDRDGDLDAFVVNHGGPAVLLRNDGGNRNHWLQVALQGTTGNRQGLGAAVRVVAGGLAQVRQVGAQASYLSQNSPVEHFGLGPRTVVDTLEVRWSTGGRQVEVGLAADQRVLVVEGRSPPSPRAPVEGGGTGAADPAESRQRAVNFWERYRAATAHRIRGEAAAAAAAYTEALALEPRHEDALYYLGNMRLEQGGGDFAGAEDAWRRLATVNPASPRAHSQLGALYLCLDPGAPFDVARAEAELQVAHDLNKEETGPLLRLGEAALLRGDWTAAGPYFEAILATHTASAAAHFYTGYLAWRAGRGERAREAFALAAGGGGRRAPAPLPAAASQEGDTKAGTAPLLFGRTRCRHLQDLSTGLDRLAPAELASTMDRRYRALDSLLAAARRRSARRRLGQRARAVARRFLIP